MCDGFLRKLGGACTLIEFSYNNSFQSSIGMAPYEALYGRPCRSPMGWMEFGEASLIGPELVQETTDKIRVICDIGYWQHKVDKKVMLITKGDP